MAKFDSDQDERGEDLATRPSIVPYESMMRILIVVQELRKAETYLGFCSSKQCIPVRHDEAFWMKKTFLQPLKGR